LYFSKRILSQRSRKFFFNIRTKSPGLNHPGISAVSHWFHFQKQLLDFPSTIAHGSTAGPFKNHFSQTHPFFENQTLIAIPHQTRPFLWTQTIRIGLNSAQRGTLYPLVRFLRSHRRETRMPNLFLSSHVLTLTVNTGRSQATAMSKPDKTFPLLILPVLPGLYNPEVWTVRVQIE
jgi:hypothetical protein